MEISSQTWCVHGGLAYGTEVNSANVNCWSSLALANAAASTETVNEQYFRLDLGGAGFTGAGSASTCFAHVVQNADGQSSGSIYGYRSRIDNTAGTITAAVGLDSRIGSVAASQTVTAFTGASVSAPSNSGTITAYTGLSVAAPAGTVTNAYGVVIADLVGATISRGVSSALSAGTGKHNLYISGTARNYLAGKTSFGADVDGELYVTSEDGYALKDGITAPAALEGYAKIFVDTSGGDLKVIFGDGVTKTIVVDS